MIENNLEIQSHLGNIAYAPMNFGTYIRLKKNSFSGSVINRFYFFKKLWNRQLLGYITPGGFLETPSRLENKAYILI